MQNSQRITPHLWFVDRFGVSWMIVTTPAS